MGKFNHILVLPADDMVGKTYVIGDVHGSSIALQAVLDRLNPEDRLVIVGDLIDRGEADPEHPTSSNVLDILINHNSAPVGTKPKIYAIQGNHERDLLKIMNIFDNLKKGDAVSKEKLFSLLIFIKNGGGWIFKHNTQDFLQRLLAFRSFSCGEKSPIYLAYIRDELQKILKSPDEHLIPEIGVYRDLIKSLPFVIKLEGNHPVLFAHSDLNISDDALDYKAENQEDFTERELDYITEARVEDFNSNGVRNSSSRLVMVGHNIIDDNEFPSANPAIPVRADTNHINLDGGAYFTKGFLLLNISDSLVTVVGKDIMPENTKFLENARNMIQQHLNTIKCANESEEDAPPFKKARF